MINDSSTGRVDGLPILPVEEEGSHDGLEVNSVTDSMRLCVHIAGTYVTINIPHTSLLLIPSLICELLMPVPPEVSQDGLDEHIVPPPPEQVLLLGFAIPFVDLLFETP